VPKIKNFLFPLILVLITVLICFLNYTPNTFLTGWDTLHPEFNFSLNFSRLFSGVWRQEQGLGTVAGHSHMADLPRVIFLFLTSFIFKLNFLRYSYIFLCFIIGPLGIYFLIKFLFRNHPPRFINLVSFLAALFYIFNLSTLQQFYVPFEMFPTQWALLPFIILFTLKYLQNHHKSDLLLFSIFTLLTTPQAYAAHLWYAFFGIYLIFLFAYFILHRNLLCFKKIITLIVFTLVLNSFWLLPNIYFIKTSSSIPEDSKVNRLYSQEYRLQNRRTGYIQDVSLIKGFYFNWQIYNHQKHNFEDLTTTWNQHLTPKIELIGFIIFVLATAGLIAAFFQKNKTLIALSPTFFIPFILLLNHTPPFSWFFDLLIKIPILEEAFRFIFTKISIIFSLSLAIYLANILNLIFTVFTKKFFHLIFSLIFIASLIIFCFPFFQGQLIHPSMKVKIPDSYFQLWQYSQTQPQGTVLPLPLNNFTGWQYYSWGYQGSGFIWFGLKQNILDRDFDRWSTQNEEAYRELFYTLYSKNTDKFFKTIEKYNLNYILWDVTSIPTALKNQDQITFKNEIENILKQLELENKVTLLKNFDHLYFYKINCNSNIFRIKQINNNITPIYQWNFYDQAYFDTGDYFTNPNQSSINYPFRQLINKNEKVINTDTLKGERLVDFNASLIDWNKAKNSELIDYLSQDTNTGSFVEFSEINHNIGLKIGFLSKNISGMPLRICVKNIYNNLCVVYEELGKNKDFNWDYFLIPPMDNFSGFSISVDNISLGNYKTHNQLKKITIDKIDLDSYLKIKTQENNPPSETVTYPQNNQISSFLYKLTIPNNFQNQTLIFSENYNYGWIAFYLNGLKPVFLKDHVLINNWANGWTIPSSIYNLKPTIYIIFWPQIFEFLGFALLIPTFIWIFKKKNQN
jgi:hypothetical protein